MTDENPNTVPDPLPGQRSLFRESPDLTDRVGAIERVLCLPASFRGEAELAACRIDDVIYSAADVKTGKTP